MILLGFELVEPKTLDISDPLWRTCHFLQESKKDAGCVSAPRGPWEVGLSSLSQGR